MERFHFVTTPFTRELRIEHRFDVDFLETEVQKLQEAVEARQSAALVGPAGSGKSVVLRTLVAKLPETRYRIVYLKLANLGARDMCRQIALGLGIPPVGTYPMLVRTLEEKISAGFFEQAMRQVFIFDDAHEMRPESIRLLRLLTNFEMDSKLVLSVILAGQLALKKVLFAPELEDVRQRLHSCGELRLFSREEARSYIAHRIKIAGSGKSPFGNDATEAIYEISQGNMRAMDKIAFASLRVAAQSKHEIVSASDVAMARTAQWM